MSHSTIEHQLASIRPRIEVISPIAGWGTLYFAIFNILLGLSVFSVLTRFGGDIAILNIVFNYQVWGAAFFIHGVIMLVGFWRNDWNLMRKSHVAGILLKSIWWFALVFRWLITFSNPTLLLIWSLIAGLQFLIYLYFLPTPPKGDDAQ